VVLKGQREMNSAEYSVIGAFAGALTGLVTTPLDVLKTRLMLQGTSGECRGTAAVGQPPLPLLRAAVALVPPCLLPEHNLALAAGQYKGVVDCAAKIIREEGTAAMFR
jgi:solute carrier family 25 S-adenosylmethionine transporter 26